MVERTFLLYGDRGERIVSGAAALAADAGFVEVSDRAQANFALAPLLQRKLSDEEIATPTLVFHPSLLPRHRGRDAIRWALASGARYSGVTWFWADSDYDAGDVCEQGVVEIIQGERPRCFYERAIDEGLRLLAFALDDFARGIQRRRPQRLAAATFEPRWPSTIDTMIRRADGAA